MCTLLTIWTKIYKLQTYNTAETSLITGGTNGRTSTMKSNNPRLSITFLGDKLAVEIRVLLAVDKSSETLDSRL